MEFLKVEEEESLASLLLCLCRSRRWWRWWQTPWELDLVVEGEEGPKAFKKLQKDKKVFTQMHLTEKMVENVAGCLMLFL